MPDCARPFRSPESDTGTPTTTVARHDQIMRVLELTREFMKKSEVRSQKSEILPRVLGVHFYGPYFRYEARGAHPGSGAGCLMEWVALFAGLPKTDRPACTNTVVASIAIHLNDALDDGARQGLKALIPELVAAVRTGDDSSVDRRLAVWCARSMPAPTAARLRALHEAVLEAAAWYLDGHVSEPTCRATFWVTFSATCRMMPVCE